MTKQARAKEHDGSAKSPASSSSGTGGGGNAARDKSAMATAEAPTPADLEHGKAAKEHGPSRTGAATGLQPGGTKPSNAPLAGEGQIGTGGASSGPTGNARKSGDR